METVIGLIVLFTIVLIAGIIVLRSIECHKYRNGHNRRRATVDFPGMDRRRK